MPILNSSILSFWDRIFINIQIHFKVHREKNTVSEVLIAILCVVTVTRQLTFDSVTSLHGYIIRNEGTIFDDYEVKS